MGKGYHFWGHLEIPLMEYRMHEISSVLSKHPVPIWREKKFEALEGELAPLFRTKLRIFAMDGLAAGHGALGMWFGWLGLLGLVGFLTGGSPAFHLSFSYNYSCSWMMS